MTDEQKAAFIMAQAAVLNAEITGMAAENYIRMYRGEALAYDEQAFQAAVNRSPCHHNAVLTLFGS